MKVLAAYLGVPLIQRAVWLILFGTALLAATEAWFWSPIRDAHTRTKARVIALQTEKATLEARLKAEESYAQTAELLDQIDARLTADIDRSAVVERLTGISAEAGTRIIHGANSFGRPRGSVRPVLQDLTVEGSYAQVGRFLNALPGLETLTLLRSAEFSANPDGTLVRVQMKLVSLSEGIEE